MIHFSVVIPVYNKANEIASTLKSVLEQSYSPAEIILVNDGSTDESEEIILGINHPKIKYFKQENQGAAAARNYGIQQVSNEYIALLDADDLWDKSFLEEVKKGIEKQPTEKVFSTGINFQQANKKSIKADYNFDLSEEAQTYNYFKASLKSSLIYSSSVVIHTSVFEEIGFFNTELKTGEDTDLWVRIGMDYPIVFIPKYLAIYKYSEKSLSDLSYQFNTHLDPDAYLKEESDNPDLNLYMNGIRYALAIQAKETNNKKYYTKFKKNLDVEKLNTKQKIILKSPNWSLKYLKKIQHLLRALGLSISSF